MPAELHVAPTGTDDADGSEQQPVPDHQPGRRHSPSPATRSSSTPASTASGSGPGAAGSATGGASPTGRRRRARRHQGLRAGDRLGARSAAPCGRSPCPTRCSARFNPFAEEIDGDWIVYADAGRAEEAPRRRVPQRAAASTRSTVRDEVSRPAAAHRGDRRLDRDRPTGSATRSRPGSSGTPRSAPTTTTIWANFQGADPNERARRDQRAPLRLLPDRAPRRLHHRARLRAGPGRQPVGAADRRPARTHRPELGQGLDHRGQRHPRRQVLGHLHRQGGLDRPQLRHDARRQARLPVPARVGLLRPADRLGPRAHRLPHHPPQHHLRLRPERHRRPPRLRVLHHRGQPHLQHRPQARVLRLRDRRHQAPRGHRRRSSGTTASTTARSAPGWTGRPRAPGSSRNLFYGNNRDLFVEVSHGPYLVDHNILASPASLELFSQGGAFVNNLVCGTVCLEPGPGPPHALPRAAQHPGRRLRRDLRRRRPLHRQHLPRRRRRPGLRADGPRRTATPATAPPDTTAIPPSLADYLALVDDPTRGDHERFIDVKQPVYIRDNVYAGGPSPYEAEEGADRPQ